MWLTSRHLKGGTAEIRFVMVGACMAYITAKAKKKKSKSELRVRTAYEQRANSVRTTREQRANNARTTREQRTNYERELTRELRDAPLCVFWGGAGWQKPAKNLSPQRTAYELGF